MMCRILARLIGPLRRDSLQAELGIGVDQSYSPTRRALGPGVLVREMAGWQRRAAWERSVPAGPPSNLKPMPYEAQNLQHGGSHAAQCRGILSLIDTSRAGRTTL